MKDPTISTIVIIIAVLLVIFAILGACKECIKKEKFIQQVVDVENVSSDVAKNMYEVRKAHKRVVNNKRYTTHSNGRRLDNDRVKAVHTDDVFCIQRWSKKLNEARNSNPDKLYAEVDRIIQEMNNRTSEYSALSTKEREAIISLANQPEALLNKYYVNEQ